MAYCRFSSDNSKSDVYVYEGERGYHVEVATTRLVEDAPPLPGISDPDFWQKNKQQGKWLSTAEREKIGGPYDGQCRTFDHVEDATAFLVELIELGYHVPVGVIGDMENEGL